jgi:hypothetical protein
VAVKDLFDLFPDLPRMARRPLASRLQDIRDSVDQLRERVRQNAAVQREAARKAQARWKKRATRSPGGTPTRTRIP